MSSSASSFSLKRVFFWLSGAGTESLEACPSWEQRKYVAFGATVLVPTVFAFIACAYALSTLTDNWQVIFPVACAWAFIIMTIDRALLATYRPYQRFTRKLGQFALRFVVALLMGLTISHPLTLLLFQDTISSVVERDREAEIDQARTSALAQKAAVEEKITGLEEEIARQREKWDATFEAKFIAEATDGNQVDPNAGEADMTEAEKRIAEVTEPFRERLAEVEKQMGELQTEYTKVQSELDFWQTEFERELNGQRSGIVGLGPRAKSIQSDQLGWRRDEARRIGGVLEGMTIEKSRLQAEIAAAEEGVLEEFSELAAAQAAEARHERERIVALKRQVQQEQADNFVVQQNAIRDTIARQIDARLEELKRLQTEIASIAASEEERIAGIRAEPRRDILTQTLALHKLFRAGDEGGQFALSAYIVLTLLFMLVDTIPLVVKFFSKPGPYDTLLDIEEVRFDQERNAFLKSYHRYMNELSGGRLLHLTQNKPLERALIEGVDRSRAAKEFLEALMEMETAFEKRVAAERARLAEEGLTGARATEKTAMLEEMVQSFYKDLRARMEQFFSDGQQAPAGPQ